MNEYALNPNIGFVPLIDKVPWVINTNASKPKEGMDCLNQNVEDDQELKKWMDVRHSGYLYNDDDYAAVIEKMLSLYNDLQEIFDKYEYEMQRDRLSEWLDEDSKALYLLND